MAVPDFQTLMLPRCYARESLEYQPLRERPEGTSMDVQAELAMAKQSFETMLSLCEPRLAGDWKPSNEQRNANIRVAESALDGLIRLEQIEHRQ